MALFVLRKVCNANPLDAPPTPAAIGRIAVTTQDRNTEGTEMTFRAFRAANVARCIKWHPDGIESWSPSDWMTAVVGEVGELASLLKMRNRERDGLPGNKFSPTDKQVADEIADVLTYLDLLAAALGVDLGKAAVSKFNEVSERVGFPDRLPSEGNRERSERTAEDVGKLRYACVQARGALLLDAMVDDEGKYYGTTTVALEALDDALGPCAHELEAIEQATEARTAGDAKGVR